MINNVTFYVYAMFIFIIIINHTFSSLNEYYRDNTFVTHIQPIQTDRQTDRHTHTHTWTLNIMYPPPFETLMVPGDKTERHDICRNPGMRCCCCCCFPRTQHVILFHQAFVLKQLRHPPVLSSSFSTPPKNRKLRQILMQVDITCILQDDDGVAKQVLYPNQVN